MKISTALIGALLLVSSHGISQKDTIHLDSLKLETDKETKEIEQRLLELGYKKKVKTVLEDGSIEYQYVRENKRRYCPSCGMG